MQYGSFTEAFYGKEHTWNRKTLLDCASGPRGGFSAPLSTQPQPRAVDVSAERGKRKRTEKSQVGRLFKVLQSLFFFPSFTVFPSAVPWEKTETFSAP